MVPLYVLDFKAAAASGADVVGGKGYNMGRLAYFGFPVPRGGVITAQAYWDFLDYNGLTPEIEALAPLSAEEAASDETAASSAERGASASISGVRPL